MLRKKLNHSESPRNVSSDHPGTSGSEPGLDLGEELEILHPLGCGWSNEGSIEPIEEEWEVDRVPTRVPKDGFCPNSRNFVEDDEKRSDLEYELIQKEINLEKLQRITSTGIPDGGTLRATTWKLLLGYLPPSRDSWQKVLSENRVKYSKLKEEYLLSPLQVSSREETSSSGEHGDGPLRRHDVSDEDHPLSLGETSAWQKYFEFTEIAEQIDRDLQRTHPDLKFFTSPSQKKKANAEADSFGCFVRLLSDSVDHFCQQLDNNSSVGIHSTLSRLQEMLKVNDEELWQHLEVTTKVNPQFYAFRWITLLLTQEFQFNTILRIWDSLLSHPSGVQDMLLRICCAMLIHVKNILLKGDFATNLYLLQHYPKVDIEQLLQEARDIIPDTSTHRVSVD
ncbi:TBC1 domain family member 13-like isoform X2 [Chenopodium quinoa]|uniref:TBC1 domain family member 13-like isoform X2 n=1 Tax=Chenopodium quinoa TaxID=63459 RepID=UPI000B76E80E|nr:TBC1 domain family member 13-like isoform X2 [Chenopodium quinoa]